MQDTNLEIRCRNLIGVGIAFEHLKAEGHFMLDDGVVFIIDKKQEVEFNASVIELDESGKFELHTDDKQSTDESPKKRLLIKNEEMDVEVLLTIYPAKQNVQVEYVDFGERVDCEKIECVNYILQNQCKNLK